MANSSIDRDPGTLIEFSGLLVDCWGLEVSDLLVDCWGLDLNLRVPVKGHGIDDLRVQEVLVTRLGILERIQLEKGVKGTKTKRIPKVTKTSKILSFWHSYRCSLQEYLPSFPSSALLVSRKLK